MIIVFGVSEKWYGPQNSFALSTKRKKEIGTRS